MNKKRHIRKFVEKQQDQPSVEKKTWLWSTALIIVLGLIVYSNSLSGPFLWDDETLVQYSPHIKDRSYAKEIWTKPFQTSGGEATNFYRPIQVLSYLLDYSFWKLNTLGYHVTNVVLHMGVALSIFWLVQLLFGQVQLSLLTALLFVVHPIHTEAVSYISGRADPLATLFLLLCVILYIKNLRSQSVATMILMGLSYVLALLSRENALILPALLFLYHATFRKPIPKASFVGLVGLTVGYIVWRWFLLGSGLPQPEDVPTLGQRIPGFFVALTDYLRLLIVPLGLHMEYGGIFFPWTEPKAIIGVIVFVIVLVYGYRKKEKDPLVFFSVFWFFIALLPFSNIYPLNAYMAEHWLYVPSVGFFLILAKGFTHLTQTEQFRVFATVIAIGLIMFYASLTVYQNSFWRDPVKLYQRIIELAPHSSRAYNNLAKVYHEKGQDEKLVELLEKAVTLEEDNAVAYNNLGNAYKNIGSTQKAIRSYQQAIAIAPEYSGPYYNLAKIYLDVEHNKEEAIRWLRQAIDVDPYLYQGYHQLGLIYFQDQKTQEAITLLEKALMINPDAASVYHSLGYIYTNSGNLEKGKMMYQKVIALKPDYVEAYHDLCVIYASENNYEKAQGYCENAVAMGDTDPNIFNVLKKRR